MCVITDHSILAAKIRYALTVKYTLNPTHTRLTTEDSYFLLDVGRDPPMERETSQNGFVTFKQC